MFKIAIVEDEINLANLTKKYFENEGYEVIIFSDGEAALKHINSDIDLWILDIMLPGVVSGYDIIKEIKQINSKVPVVFTSARVEEFDKVIGLSMGSDDYISKPYSNRELVLRVKNILARVYSNEKIKENKEKFGKYEIDYDKRIVTENDININLTSKEYDLLLLLITNKAKAFSRDQILDNVWGSDYFGSDRVVDDLMRRLRQKMPDLNVETIYGFGYRLLV